jgi:hypothetical protein
MMSKILDAADAGNSIGLYDSATGESLVTRKAVDVTDDCPSGERTILLYTQAKRGPIVQICNPYEDEPAKMGMHVHFFIDELDRDNEIGEVFASHASRLGHSAKSLLKLVRDLQ